MATIRQWTGREVRALREAFGMNPRELGLRLGVSERSVSNWEAGATERIPREDKRAMLDRFLGRAPDDVRTRFQQFLMGGTEMPETGTDGQEGKAELYDIALSYMDRRGMSVRALSKAVYRDPSIVSKALHGKRACGPALARDIDTVIGAGGEFIKAAARMEAETQMPYARTSLRREKRHLRESMRAMGLEYRQIAMEFARAYKLRPRAAWREAYGWSLQDAADRINDFRGNVGLDPRGISSMTAPHLSEYESWPGYGGKPSGRRPNPYLLAVLASIYGCHVSDLIDLADRKHLPKADLLVIETYARPPVSVSVPAPRLNAVSGKGEDDIDGESSTENRAESYSPALFGNKSPDSPIVSGGEFTEDAIDVLGRIRKLHKGSIHPEIIRTLQDDVSHTVARYGSVDDSGIVPSLLKQRGWVESLLDECSNLAQRRQLLEIAGVTSGILGYVAVGRGEFPLARAYCLEAFELGDFTENANIKAWGRALQSFCEYYLGRYDEALTLARDGLTYMRPGLQNVSLAINEMALTARSFLASAYRAAGDLTTAAPLHQQNLADCESALGTDHPETLVSRANLAYLYALQDQPEPALELHQRNLTDYQRVHGPNHPHTLNARANLASSYRALGDLARAIELHQQSVTDYARVYGPDHSETITARSNLAYAYQLANDYGQAIPLHKQVLTDRERLNGPQHIYTELARQLLTRAQQPA